jgi:Zn-dependent oligopeptidase
MVKELAPIMVNWFVKEDFIASIAVSMPTSAIMPKAMIQIVSIALTLFERIALNEILKFSLNMLTFIISLS